MTRREDDDLSAFDDLSDSGSHAEPQWEPLDADAKQNEAAQRSGRLTRRVGVALVIVLLIGLAVWNWWPRNSDSTDEAAPAADETTATETAAPQPSPTTNLDGDGPQATEQPEEPTPNAVEVAEPSEPDVDTSDPESVMKAFLSALNNRTPDDDLTQIEDWTADYVALDSIEPVDPFTENGPMGGRAPTETKKVDLTEVEDAKPADSSTHRTREAEVTVMSHTGKATVQTWEIAASKDGETWKVTDATLDSWTGATD